MIVNKREVHRQTSQRKQRYILELSVKNLIKNLIGFTGHQFFDIKFLKLVSILHGYLAQKLRSVSHVLFVVRQLVYTPKQPKI